jgi:hypothetical protein
MSGEAQYPNDLVTLTTTETEFQAGILVAVLKEAGITAYSFAASSVIPLGQRVAPVVVQVRHRDLEHARAALTQNASDSVDLDWDDVDVGQRVDDVEAAAEHGMPMVIKLGLIVAAIAVLIMVIGVVLVIFYP